MEELEEDLDFTQDIDFTEEEIKDQLASLGYHDVTEERLRQFKQDLEELVKHEKSRNTSAAATQESHYESQELFSQAGRAPLHDTRNAGYSGAYTTKNYKHQGISGLPHDHYGKENGAFSSSYARYERTPPRKMYPSSGPSTYSRYHPSMRREGVQRDEQPQRERDKINESVDSQAVLNESLTSTAGSEGGGRLVKRKVVRKQRNGEPQIFDESFVSTDTDDIQQRLTRLPLDDVSEEEDASVRPHLSARSYPWRPSSARDMVSNRDEYGGDPSTKSLILPLREHPHTRHVNKCDPVRRYQQFKQAWGENRAPGEKAHKGLRWSIKEQMLYHDDVVKKSQRVFVPNKYVVPTDKKRKAIRWQVRADMAQGVNPSAGYQL